MVLISIHVEPNEQKLIHFSCLHGAHQRYYRIEPTVSFRLMDASLRRLLLIDWN